MRAQLVYDGTCAFCRAQMRLLQKLDWFGTIRFVPVALVRSLKLPAEYTEERLLQAIHCVTTKGKIYSGAKAFRHACLGIPLLAPIAVLMWIPGAIHPAERLYGWIARNRHRFFIHPGKSGSDSASKGKK
jgi:predicted DCC family thiol-disulfide oxidoreductase YuxK